MHLNSTYNNSWNRKQNKVYITLDSVRRKHVRVLLIPSAATSLVASVNLVNCHFT